MPCCQGFPMFALSNEWKIEYFHWACKCDMKALQLDWNDATPKPTKLKYDSFSVEPTIWVRWGHESESGQMVLKKVKVTYFDAYLWQTMWNHAKKSMEESKLSDLVFLQWDVRSSVLKTPKNTKTRETKTQITQILKRYDLSRVVPCERARPEHSENVVVFEVSMF